MKQPGRRAAAVRAWIEAQPGAVGAPLPARRGAAPAVMIYKVMGRMFAIWSLRGGNVILKCDPLLVTVLRGKYAGVGHRSHLDRRFWISVELDADVPLREIRRLVSQSYRLVCAQLTARQRIALAGL